MLSLILTDFLIFKFFLIMFYYYLINRKTKRKIINNISTSTVKYTTKYSLKLTP